jgi:hypothetical protein
MLLTAIILYLASITATIILLKTVPDGGQQERYSALLSMVIILHGVDAGADGKALM